MSAASDLDTAREFARFAIVGVVSNAALFALYLVMTDMGTSPKLAATIAYALGVLQTFTFNRSWSFRDIGTPGPALARYVVVYAGGYIANMLVLAVLVDRAGYPHQWVQGATIVALAIASFLLQKYWVFREKVRVQ